MCSVGNEQGKNKREARGSCCAIVHAGDWYSAHLVLTFVVFFYLHDVYVAVIKRHLPLFKSENYCYLISGGGNELNELFGLLCRSGFKFCFFDVEFGGKLVCVVS